MIASEATGFLYCVSSNGVTGVRSEFDTNFAPFFEKIYKYAKVPCAVGFGISGAEAAKQMSKYCDGVIVGSAIVRQVGEYGGEAAPEKDRRICQEPARRAGCVSVIGFFQKKD